MELWDKEEFQPVKALLKSMSDETVMSIRTVAIMQSAEVALVNLAIAKTQLNIVNMLLELPKVIQTTREGIEARQAKGEAYKQSQRPDFEEGGN